MKRFKLGLASAALATSAAFAACGSDAPSNQAANAPNSNTAAAPTPAAPTPPPDQFAAARNDYKQFCIRCHKEDGTGGVTELDEGGKIKVPNFREGHGARHTEEQMVKKIQNGDADEGMPAFKNRLDPERINALARFIRHEFQGQSSAGAGAAAANSPTPAH